MSTIEVDKVIPQSGTALQVGEASDTINVPSGATLNINSGATITNNGTASGFDTDTNDKVKVSTNDTTPGFLNGKLVAGTNISLTEGSDGGNETLTAALSGTITPSDNTVTLAKMAPGTDGNIISYDASGNPVAVATGNDGQVLTSAGAGAPPVFETPASALNTPAFLAYANGDQYNIPQNTYTKLTNYISEVFDTDNKFASSRFTPGVVGKYFVYGTAYAENVDGYRTFLNVFVNGSNYQTSAIAPGSSSNSPQQVSTIVNVTNTSDYIELYLNSTGGNNTAFSSGVEVKFGGFKILT